MKKIEQILKQIHVSIIQIYFKWFGILLNDGTLWKVINLRTYITWNYLHVTIIVNN